MKKIAFLCLLTALFCSCSVLSTTSDTTIRDSKGHPLGGYKYFHVYSDAQIRTTTSTSSSENGAVFFDLNGKRIWIKGGILVVEEL